MREMLGEFAQKGKQESGGAGVVFNHAHDGYWHAARPAPENNCGLVFPRAAAMAGAAARGRV
jgi:hypothetical protein